MRQQGHRPSPAVSRREGTLGDQMRLPCVTHLIPVGPHVVQKLTRVVQRSQVDVAIANDAPNAGSWAQRCKHSQDRGQVRLLEDGAGDPAERILSCRGHAAW